jgi:hypothetical protein
MKVKLNTFVIWSLAFPLVLAPVLCCCMTNMVQAQGHVVNGVAKSDACCDSKNKNAQPQHDSSKCACPNHSLAKAVSTVPGAWEVFSAQRQLSLYPISFLVLALSSNTLRYASAHQVDSSPPPHASNPLYIEFRALRL